MVLGYTSPSEHSWETEAGNFILSFRIIAPQAFLLSAHRSAKEYFPSFSNTLASSPPFNFISIVGFCCQVGVFFFPKLTVSDFVGRVVPLSCLGFKTWYNLPLTLLPLRGQLTLDLSIQQKVFMHFEVLSKL